MITVTKEKGLAFIGGGEPYSCRCTEAGNITEFQTIERKPAEFPTVRISSDEYTDKRTGEILPYSHTVNRAQGFAWMRDTLKRLRGLINSNTAIPDNLRWVTLTYAENMQDADRLRKDFEHFWKRLKRRLGDDVPEYISVAEPQARGAWHLHLILIWSHSAPFLDNNLVAECWAQGFTKTRSVSSYSCDNLGAYFSAYLANLPLDDLEAGTVVNAEKVIELDVLDDEDGNRSQKKKFIKGARLYLYPAKFNLYRTSQGVARPETVVLSYDEALEKKASAGTLTFAQTVTVCKIDDEQEGGSRCLNVVTTEYYNKNARKSQ